MEPYEQLEREILKAETLKTHYENMYGRTSEAILTGKAIARARSALDSNDKLSMAQSIKELQALE